MTDEAAPAAGLPPAVLARVVALAAGHLAALPAAEVPAPLRRLRTFTPAKRARLGAAVLGAALDTDRAFRAAVVAGVREALPVLAAALAQSDGASDGGPSDGASDGASGGQGDGAPLGVPLTDAAAVAWLLRAPGWQRRVAAAADHEAAVQEGVAARAGDAQLGRLRAEVAGLRADAQRRGEAHAAEVAALAAGVAEARRRARPVEAAARRAEAAARAQVETLGTELAAAREAAAQSGREVTRLRARVAELEAAVTSARRATRGDRGERVGEDARVRVLLDTLLAAGQGLRRALAPAVDGGERPGDAVVAGLGAEVAPVGGVVEDPQALDALLGLPTVHLVVDGYNVTKTGYGGLALDAQRHRLVATLAALVARTGAEVTVVFDGAGRPALSAPGRDPRGVRVAWSPPGMTADDVVLQLVAAEPPGRPVLVVSADREVIRGARARGARPVASSTLLARLDRA